MHCPGMDHSLTVRELIDRVDELAPNQYSDAQKARWLADLDDRAARQLGRVFAVYPGAVEDGGELERELRICRPFAADVYENYLLARIAERNAEIQKYNLYAALFNEAWQSFLSCCLREHKPKSRGGWKT